MSRAPPGPRAARAWRVVGGLCVAVGLVGAFVPLLPTTVFLILGAWAYGKGAPELRARLLAHPRYGPGLRLWLEQGRLTRAAKVKAALAIVASYALTLLVLGPSWMLAAVGAGLAGLIAFLATRPQPPDGAGP